MAEESPHPRPRRRLLIPDLAAGEQRTITIDGATAHHALKVLRLGVGDTISLFSGTGLEASATIVAIDREAKSLSVEASAPQQQAAPACQLIVGLAAPKGERADWAVEKLTELGVARICWLVCERSVVEPRPSRLERHRRIAAAAAAQCGRATLPEVSAPTPLATFLTATTAQSRWAADRDGPALRAQLTAAVATAAIIIGPEGGLTRHELEDATKHGYTIVSLGSWILRVETAAVAAASLLLGG